MATRQELQTPETRRSVPPQRLKEFPLFADLPPEILDTLGAILTSGLYQPGQKIFHYGNPGDRLFFICRGKLTFSLTDNLGHTEDFGGAGKGECVGEVAVFARGVRTADGRVTEELVTLELRRDDVDQFLDLCPPARRLLMESMARRLEDAAHRSRHGVDRVSRAIENQRTPADRRLARLVDTIANGWFLAAQFIIGILWCAINLRERGPDPFPYPFLALFFSAEALVVTLLILSYQNREEKDARIRDAAQSSAADEVNRRLDELLKRIPPPTS